MPTEEKKSTIKLTSEEVEALKARVLSSEGLSSSDRNILVSILSVYFWLQNQLQSAKLSILRLKKIFGVPTEKKTLD